MRNLSCALAIKIHKCGTVYISIEQKSKKSILITDLHNMLILHIDLVIDIFKKFGEISNFTLNKASKSMYIHYKNEMSVNDVLSIPKGTVERIKVVPFSIESIRAERDSKYMKDPQAFVIFAEAHLKKYYEDRKNKRSKKADEDGWTVISGRKKVKVQEDEENSSANFDDDDEEINSDDC